MSALDDYGDNGVSPEDVTLRYVGTCQEGNCDFTVDCPDKTVAHRTAGRHEGANDFQHQIDLQVIVDVDD